MKIWKLKFNVEEYDSLVPVKYAFDKFQFFDGRKKESYWIPLPVKRMEPETGLDLGDASGFMGFPTFNQKALNALEPLIRDSVEVLPLAFKEKPYWGINVVSVLDVLDYSKSIYRIFPNTNKIAIVEKYAFRNCAELKNHNIFKIVDEPRGRSFVSEKFKNAVEQNNLTGFLFELVWDSDIT